MKMNLPTEKQRITGIRLIYTLVEQNMQLAIYYTAVCGRKYCVTLGLQGLDEGLFRRLVNQGMITGGSRSSTEFN